MTDPRPSTPDRYRQVLDTAFAARYRHGRDSWTEEPAMRRVLDAVLPDLVADSHVLDVGAGRGRDTVALLAAGHRVTAVDLVAVPEWDAIVRHWGERVRFHAGNVVDLDVHGEFDAVLDNGCLHHQHPDDYDRYLATLRRALRPGGLLAVSFFVLTADARTGVLHVEEDGRLAYEFTVPEAVTLIATAGFRVVGQRRVPRSRPDRAYLVVVARRPGA
jgi:SAM-dependent methyltransferase